MKLSNALAPLIDLRLSIQQAFFPTLFTALKSPALIFRPRALSRLFFHHVWVAYGSAVNDAGREVKDELVPPNAFGVVLELGAGHGHTALYLSPARVTKYVALEPNLLMHPYIRATAARNGFFEETGTLVILSCGAEDINIITSALGGLNSVDTIISILTLCSVPRPEHAIKCLINEVLKPGGQLLFYEHVASKKPDVRFWQGLWSPIWKIFFDGCECDRKTDEYIRNFTVWEEFPGVDAEGGRVGIWGKKGEGDESIFWHQVGRLIKRIY